MIAEDLSDLFELHLECACDGEMQMAEELKKLIEATSSADLRDAFKRSLEKSHGRLQRLNSIFESLNRAAAATRNHIVRDALSEAGKFINHIDRSPLLDTALIITMNQARHSEIARYGALNSLAQLQGFKEAADLLSQTLAEEKAEDQEFTTLAVNTINPDAVGFRNSPRFAVI